MTVTTIFSRAKLLVLCVLILSSMPLFAQHDDLLKELNDKMDRDTISFVDYVKKTYRDFYAYLDSLDRDYAMYLEKQWKPVKYIGTRHYQRDKEQRPTPDPNEKMGLQLMRGAKIINIEKQAKQPLPPAPIKENNLSRDYGQFFFYNTPLHVRWGKAKSFRFPDIITKKEIAKAYILFSELEYKNLLHDCLKLRRQYKLCDWAYYQMLGQLGTAFYGEGSNEAVFIQGMLFGKSGYAIRFAIDQEKKALHLLCAINGFTDDYPIYEDGGMTFCMFEKKKGLTLDYCPKEYQGEQIMSLAITESPLLQQDLSEQKIIHANSYPVSFTSRVNRNLIDFYNSYPTSYKDGNIMTRWAYYAQAPASRELKEGIYPQLRAKLQGLPPLQAINMLLNWLQPPIDDDGQQISNGQKGLSYGYDNVIWERDRAFFAEETLYYPFSDCEDHAILFSRLVRDLLGLDVALVYYPKYQNNEGKTIEGHLATAVCFGNGEINGKAFDIDGRLFIIADPTMRRGRVGSQAIEYRDIDPKLIQLYVLKR